MKKNILFNMIAISIVISSVVLGSVWRVNNNTGTSPDFTTLQAAHDGAAYGDTLYIEGSSTSYGDAVITKQLTVIGPGYFLTENPNTQANPLNGIVGTVTLNNGSQGSEFSGLQMNHVAVNTDEIIIRRNYIVATATYSASTVQINNSQNVLVTQNYIYHVPNHNSTYYGVEINNGSFITVQNNFIRGRVSSLYFVDSGSCVFRNNIIYDGVSGSGQQLINNILFSGTYSGENDLLNNLCNGDQFGTGNGNQSNIDMNIVFTGTGSTDGQWQLVFNSPASGAGFDGEDCGMFGGLTPYVLSGMPNIPAIYQFVAPSVVSPTSALPVHIEAKSHSEE
ncbi:MAG: hypothetical protein GXO91_04320 [FCB group bacterium]|nr:hypothetical protein [FCB group bacterium]